MRRAFPGTYMSRNAMFFQAVFVNSLVFCFLFPRLLLASPFYPLSTIPICLSFSSFLSFVRVIIALGFLSMVCLWGVCCYPGGREREGGLQALSCVVWCSSSVLYPWASACAFVLILLFVCRFCRCFLSFPFSAVSILIFPLFLCVVLAFAFSVFWLLLSILSRIMVLFPV